MAAKTQEAPPEEKAPAEESAQVDEFRQQQLQLAREQNVQGDNAVPETRPQAFLVNDPGPKSELTKRLEEAGLAVTGAEPATEEDYKRAASEGQMAKAAESSVVEGAHPGSMVRATKGPHEGRVFAVTRIIQEADDADLIRRATGDPAALYNQPKELELRAVGDERDGEQLVLDVVENGLVKLNEAYRGSRAGRLH